MIQKVFIGIMMLITALTVMVALFYANEHQSLAVERTADKVIGVDSASGVIIYSDDIHTIVLTSYHIIMDKVSTNGAYTGEEKVSVVFKISGINISYEAYDIAVDPSKDLAAITIIPNFRLHYTDITNVNPSIGEDIFLIGNPNFNYRTVTKGIISNKNRKQDLDITMWQVSGGVIYGSSGGGAFNSKGELIGIIRSVDLLETDFCAKQQLSVAEITIEMDRCYQDPMPHMGFIVPAPEIREFLSSNGFGFIF